MVRRVIVGFALASAVLTGPANAQDVFDGLIAGVDTIGHAVGEAAMSGSSILLTARGRAPLPAPLADSYFVSVEAHDASAVQAAHIRDAKIAQLTALGRHTGVTVEQGDTTIVLEEDPDDQRAAAERLRATNPSTPMFPLPTVPKTFHAKASLRFQAPPGGDVAAFLDAVHAIGIDDISHGVAGRAPGLLPQSMEAFGFGAVDELDDAVWVAAASQALAHARAQAGAIAAASGHTVGAVRSVTVVSRSIAAGEASESLAVRFDLGPASAAR